MKSAFHYIGYTERKGMELRKQILTRGYVFLAIDIVVFIAHAIFLSFDMGFGGNAPTASFLHVVTHLLSLLLIAACLFLQVSLYNAIANCTSLSGLRATFMHMAEIAGDQGEEGVAAIAQDAIIQDMLEIEEASKKAARLLDIIEYFTCGACCLLFLIPIS